MSRKLVLSLCALAALVAPAGAQAATPGLLNNGVPNGARVHEAADAGAKIVRQFVIWRAAEPANGNFDDDNPGSYRDALREAVNAAHARGVKLLWNVVETPGWANGSAGPYVPPTNAAEYGEFVAWVMDQAVATGHPEAVAGIAVWNEPNADDYFHGARKVDRNDRSSITQRAGEYAALLKAAYRPIKDRSPQTQVVLGGLVGGDWRFLEDVYGAGARDSFDVVGMDADYACLVDGPDSFYREGPGGRIGQINFLAYRELRETVLANGQDKPIWLASFGWSTSETAQPGLLCKRGASAGKKAAGVTEAAQARHITQAYQCVANDPYVEYAILAYVRDENLDSANPEFNHYGILRSNGTQKPGYGAFQAAVQSNGGAPGPCGDFDAPSINVVSPTPGQQFTDRIDVKANATDNGVGLGRISFGYNGGSEIRNYTESLSNGTTVGLAPWFGSRDLPLGRHTIRVQALDRNQNLQTVEIPVEKVKTLVATLKPVVKFARKGARKCKGRSCTLKGSLSRGKAGTPSIGGKVAVEWQWRNKQGRYRKLAGGLKPANKPFTFKAKLKKAGRWRVRVVYKGGGSWKPVTSKWLNFRVR